MGSTGEPGQTDRTMVDSNKTNEIEELFSVLEGLSAGLPPTLTRALFDNALFQCRSEKTSDFLQEIRDNLQILSGLTPGNERYLWFYEHCEAQIMAFVQGAMRNPRTAKNAALSRPKVQSNATRHQRLQQELVLHHDYERRLKDNLSQAQTQAAQQQHAAEAQAKVIVCQQRLLRCQRAIVNLERQLEAF